MATETTPGTALDHGLADLRRRLEYLATVQREILERLSRAEGQVAQLMTLNKGGAPGSPRCSVCGEAATHGMGPATGAVVFYCDVHRNKGGA